MSLGDYENYIEGDQDTSKGTGEVSLPGAPSLHTHSSKFPIEREVIVKSSNEKQCKIPNLSDYMRRAKPSVAPDAPPKQVAWTHQINKNDGENASGIVHDIAAHQLYKAQPMSVMDSTKESEPSPIRPANHQELGPATSTPEGEGARGLPQRTYQSLKDMISSRFSKQNGSAGVGPAPGSPNLENSLSPQSQLRQHGVYIGSPQSTQQQPQQTIEMRGMRQSHQQQQRMLERQQQQQQQQFQSHHPQQIHGTPQLPYKYPHLHSGQPSGSTMGTNMGLPPTASYQPLNDTPTSWRQYNGEGAIPKTQSVVDNQINPATYTGANGSNDIKSYNPENITTSNYNGEPKYGHSKPPSSQQQQYRGGLQSSGRNMSSARPPGGTIYQTTPNQNDYHPHQTQFTQGSVIVHAPQEGNPEEQNKSNGKSVDQNHREGPQGAAALAGPSMKEDDDEGGFVKRGAQSDSGRGSTVYSSAKTSAEDTTPPLAAEPSEWSERVENELRQILNGPGSSAPPGGGLQGAGVGGLTSATGPINGSSESFSSVSPPLPPLSPHSSEDTYRRPRLAGYGTKGGSSTMWTARTKEKPRSHKHGKTSKDLLCSGLEIDSMLDENNSSEDDEYTDTRAIRKQLEGLETMYAQVLKLLGVKQKHGLRYEASDPRIIKRRPCGSISSAPSSVSSRPIRATDRRGRAGKVRDVRGINKRFQRLESHVVTLARSVAHLSSEMRTQHIMMQEMEMMRGELAALRVQTNINQQTAAAAAHHVSMSGNIFNGTSCGPNTTKQNNSTPEKVKRLTKFFGDEPPLLRLFLRRLGYEKYASAFEKERIGLLELPFMTEERLHKLGIPLGPRLRIMQQAHLANPNTLCVL